MPATNSDPPDARPIGLKMGSKPRLWSYWSDPDGVSWLVTGAFAKGVNDRPQLILCERQNGECHRVDVQELLQTWKSSSKP